MTKRATFTQVELERAIRAAGKLGKVAAVTADGLIVFVESGIVALPSQEQVSAAEVAECDKAFGVSR